MAKILVIDDATSTLELVENILTREGHSVTACDSGKHGAEWLERGGFDLVLTDVYMPEGDGLEVLRNVRRLHPGLAVIAMSGVTGHYDMLGIAKALGASGVLRKPFSTAELLEALSACLPALSAAEGGEPGA